MTDTAIMSAPATAEARKTRAAIVAMAERHFKRYGYAKTTIVEIARDCAMSHANVYRFFRSKADLADAVAELWLEKIIEVGKRVAAGPGTPTERLSSLALELYQLKKREALRSKSVHELIAQAEINGRPSVESYHRHMTHMYATIIEEGIRSGEFRATDSQHAADVILTATIKFSHPLLVEQFAEHDLEPLLREVMELLLAGLRA
jgi:AcrR family transcriptional regulator